MPDTTIPQKPQRGDDHVLVWAINVKAADDGKLLWQPGRITQHPDLDAALTAGWQVVSVSTQMYGHVHLATIHMRYVR